MRTKLAPNRITCRGHLGLDRAVILPEQAGASRAAESYWKLALNPLKWRLQLIAVAAAVARVPSRERTRRISPAVLLPRMQKHSAQNSQIRRR